MVPLSDQAAVEQEAEQWAELWKSDDFYMQPDFSDIGPELEPATIGAVKAAAMTFPINTGLGADNFSPRAVCRLSDEAICALVVLFAAFERCGNWCQALDLVLIVLLPKTDGGRRPIGLFCSIVRLWMRTRIWLARAWEAAHALPEVFAGPDMGAQKAAWQASFSAESAALTGEDHAQGLLDLVKAFETVPHDMLVQAARMLGYPLRLIKLSLAAYRLRRTVGIDGVYSKMVRACRGITAGSGFATTELKVLLHDLMVLLRARWPRVLLSKLYVDDLTLAASGAPQIVIRVVAEAIDFAVEFLEVGLGMEVSAKKSKVLASRRCIAEAILCAARTHKTSAANHCKLLGTDSVGGRKRCTATFRLRLKSFAETVAGVKTLGKAGVSAKQMVRAAGNPAVLYGCETFGIADSVLETTRSKFARAVAPDTGGRNPLLTLLAVDGEAGTLDPAFVAHASPVQHWAIAIYDSWFPQDVLRRTFEAAQRKVTEAGDKAWSIVHGPTTALLATTQRIAWDFESPFSVVSDIGETFDLRLDSPSAVACAVREGVRRWRWRQAATLLPGLLPNVTDNGDGTPSCNDLVVGCFGSVDKLLRKKGCPKAAGKVSELWQAKFAGDLASAISGGQWSQQKKASIEAFQVDDSRCQLCLESVGTLPHRFDCIKTRPTSGWPAPPKEAIKAIEAIGHRRREILKLRGLMVLRLQPNSFSSEGEFRWIADPHSSSEASSATWYFDGSMLLGKCKPLRTTGFGIAVVSTDGSLLGYGLGWPPFWCTTAAAAEAWALGVVLVQCPFPPEMRTDCLALLTTARMGTHKAVHHSRPLARIWRVISNAIDTDISSLLDGHLLAWFPAHKSLKAIGEVKGSNGRRMSAVDWRANRLVDKLAKTAAEAVLPSQHVRALVLSADAATGHAAGLLGIVTHAANNFEVCETDGSGKEVRKTVRDSSDRPRAKRALSAPAPCKQLGRGTVPKAAVERAVRPWRPPSALALDAVQNASSLQRRVAEIGAGLSASAGATGKQRLEAVAERLRLRSASLGPS